MRLLPLTLLPASMVSAREIGREWKVRRTFECLLILAAANSPEPFSNPVLIPCAAKKMSMLYETGWVAIAGQSRKLTERNQPHHRLRRTRILWDWQRCHCAHYQVPLVFDDSKKRLCILWQKPSEVVPSPAMPRTKTFGPTLPSCLATGVQSSKSNVVHLILFL